MADTRTLKLALVADINKFTTGMSDADKSTKQLKDKTLGHSKKMSAAFLGVAAAVGILAGKIGVDSIKAASDDQLSQNKLKDAILKTKGATDDTVTSTEKWISKMQFTKGFSDEQLRPALADLTRYTGDVDTAQRLLNDAMDIAAAKGVPLETVAKGIGKAYNGQYTALNKLGVPLDAAKTKSGDFEGIMKDLNKQFNGAAASNAETYAGKVNILGLRFGELQESLGSKLIDKFTKVVDITAVVAKGFSGENPNEGLSSKVQQISRDLDGGGKGGAYNLGSSLKAVADAFGTLFGAISGEGPKSGNDNLQSLADALQAVAKGINAVASAYAGIKSFGGKLLDTLQIGEGKAGFASGIPGIPFGNQGPNGRRANGGPVSAGRSYLVGERGPEILRMGSRSGSITPNSAMGGNTFIFNGVLDAASARQSIERLLQTQSRISGPINLAGAMP